MVQFDNYEWNSEFDAFKILNMSQMTIEEVNTWMDHLSDTETKYRITLWLSHHPTAMYDDLHIEALKNYSMFVFGKVDNDIVVFEAFVPSNAFYVFSAPNGISDLLNRISGMTKTQMALSEYFVDRGKHIQNHESLEKRIDLFFS